MLKVLMYLLWGVALIIPAMFSYYSYLYYISTPLVFWQIIALLGFNVGIWAGFLGYIDVDKDIHKPH